MGLFLVTAEPPDAIQGLLPAQALLNQPAPHYGPGAAPSASPGRKAPDIHDQAANFLKKVLITRPSTQRVKECQLVYEFQSPSIARVLNNAQTGLTM